MLLSANPKSIEWCLGKKHAHPDEYVREFKSLKPCIIGCDAHQLDKIGVPPNGRFTWIKSDVSFEGLKQITYEPESRVRIQHDNPSEEYTYAQIGSLDVNFPNDLRIRDKQSNERMNFCLQGKQTVMFSPNLTCIIGGRGSGKSTLIHLLYNASTKPEIDRLIAVTSPLADLQLAGRDAFSKVRALTTVELPLETEFFLQNEVEKFAKDITEMSKLIRSRLYALSAVAADTDLSALELEWDFKAAECQRLTMAYDKITEIDRMISVITKQRQTLKKQTDVISSEEYKTLQSDIESCAAEMSSFRAFEKEYMRLLAQLESLIAAIAMLDWSKFENQSALASLSADLARHRLHLERSFSAAKEKHERAGYEEKAKDKTEQLKRFLKDKGLSAENIGEVAGASLGELRI